MQEPRPLRRYSLQRPTPSRAPGSSLTRRSRRLSAAMRRGQQRASRNERIIHGVHGAYDGEFARTRVPRGQAKIRSLDDGDRDAVHAFEDSLRRHWADNVGLGVGADVAEAAAELSRAARHGKLERKPTPPASKTAKAAAPAVKAAFSLAALPKPLRHLLAGAFSGGAPLARCALPPRASAAPRARNPATRLEYCLTLSPCRTARAARARREQDDDVAAGGCAHEAHGWRKGYARLRLFADPYRRSAHPENAQACAWAKSSPQRGQRAACAASSQETWLTSSALRRKRAFSSQPVRSPL